MLPRCERGSTTGAAWKALTVELARRVPQARRRPWPIEGLRVLAFAYRDFRPITCCADAEQDADA